MQILPFARYYPTIRLIVVLITIVICGYYFQKNLPQITLWLNHLGIFAPLLFIVVYTLSSIFCLPGVLLLLATGALYGPLFGSMLNIVSAISGAICCFFLSRYIFKDAFFIKNNTYSQKVFSMVDRYGWKAVAILRLTPAIPFNIISYGFGITQIKFLHYALATAIFIIPNKVIITYFGYAGIKILNL